MSMFAVTEPTTGSISNEYIQFNYLNGYHGVVTTGGNPDNPNDDNKLLIYGGGSTSYTTIRIDGNNYEFSPDTVTRYDNKIIGTKRIGDVIVSQHIGIIPNQYTGRDDVVEFFYTVENTSDTPHDVGVRIMFDTMLGNNDSAPFRLPAVGDVTTETDLSGEEIPEFWQAFDNLTNPKVIAQGTLKVDKASTPDRVRFTNWRSAVGNPWDYVRPAGSSNGDSAVCLYWNEQMLEKDDTLACKTFYGLSALQQDLRPPLALALTGATKLEVVKNKDGKDEYSPNPFTVTAYIENIGTGTATNTKITLNLPKGMEVVNGQKTVSLGNIPVGTKQYQVSWKINVVPSAVDKIEEYSVTLVADNAEAKTLKRAVTIPKLQTSQLKLLLDRSSIKDGNQLTLKFKIVNEGEEAVDLSQLCARYYYTDESPKVNKQLNCDWAQFNNPYGALKNNVTMNSFQNIEPLRQDANAYIEFGFTNDTKKLLSGQEVVVSARVNNSTWSKMIMSNDYSFIGAEASINQDFVVWKYMPIYSKLNNELVYGIEPKVTQDNKEYDLHIDYKTISNEGDNKINLSIRLTNNSVKPIDLKLIEMKYFYTNDDGYSQEVRCDYAGGRIENIYKAITSNVLANVNELKDSKQNADTYVTVNFGQESGILNFEDYVDINLRIYSQNRGDCNYTLNNDYSNQDTNNVIVNILGEDVTFGNMPQDVGLSVRYDKIEGPLYRFTMLTDEKIDEALMQFRLNSNKWMTLSIIRKDPRFIMNYNGIDSSTGKYKYIADINISLLGNRQFRAIGIKNTDKQELYSDIYDAYLSGWNYDEARDIVINKYLTENEEDDNTETYNMLGNNSNNSSTRDASVMNDSDYSIKSVTYLDEYGNTLAYYTGANAMGQLILDEMDPERFSRNSVHYNDTIDITDTLYGDFVSIDKDTISFVHKGGYKDQYVTNYVFKIVDTYKDYPYNANKKTTVFPSTDNKIITWPDFCEKYGSVPINFGLCFQKTPVNLLAFGVNLVSSSIGGSESIDIGIRDLEHIEYYRYYKRCVEMVSPVTPFSTNKSRIKLTTQKRTVALEQEYYYIDEKEDKLVIVNSNFGVIEEDIGYLFNASNRELLLEAVRISQEFNPMILPWKDKPVYIGDGKTVSPTLKTYNTIPTVTYREID